MKNARSDRQRSRWLRAVVIITAAIILASCRSLTTPLSLPAVSLLPAAMGPNRVDEIAVQVVGCEQPCPPLLRQPLHSQTSGRPVLCRPLLQDNQPCRSCQPTDGSACQSATGMLLAREIPVAGPYLVCDGGDCLALAQPTGASGLKNLHAGDTVARYHADDFGPDVHDVKVAISNRACVYAPRFASVRHITRPHEEAAPVGIKGLSLDTVTELGVRRQPVWGSTQRIAPEAARKALPGVAIEERLFPMAVDQNAFPKEASGENRAVARVADERPMLTKRKQSPLLQVGFEVPMAWTCVRGAQVIVMGRTAEVIAADRGTATLRIEEQGRAELTLCKQVGSDTARIGEELDFTIYLLNSGDRPLRDVVLVDALPARLELIPQSAAANLSAEFSTEKGDDGSVVLKWRFESPLAAGEGGFVRFRTLVH